MSGDPAPKKPKRKTQANIAINMTFLIPNFFMKKGIRRIHRVSEACEIEIRALEFLTANESGETLWKDPRNKLA